MNKPLPALSVLAAAALLGACGVLQPRLPAADPGIAERWPLAPVADASRVDPGADATAVADIGWRDFFVDPQLGSLIGLALDNNRDLRVAILEIERARAQYGIQRADRLPSIGVAASLTRSRASDDLYAANLRLTEFELDLFGRVASLSDAALERYLATVEARRSTQLALIAEVAGTWLALAADQQQQRIAQATLENYEAVYRLTEQRHALGAVSALDVAQTRTIVEGARSDAARFTGLVAQDRNALALLVGARFDPALLPTAFAPQVSGVQALPAGVPSEVLLRRPDVLAAEHLLRAANADIGAARAAFFPSIRLTAASGSASSDLDSLFDGGTGTWSFLPRIDLPIFQGGRLRAALGVATASRDIALAQYERAIQAGFREVADALALSVTIAEQRYAQEALLQAALRAHELSAARYKAGQDSYLVFLDAQRTLFSARLSLVAIQQREQVNRVQLFKALGGGWLEQS